MGNSKKPKRPELSIGSLAHGEFVSLPKVSEEKAVLKEVPACIRWAEVPNIDRMDREVVGKTIIYEDNSFDVVYDFENMSEDAKTFLGYYQSAGPYSIGDQGVN